MSPNSKKIEAELHLRLEPEGFKRKGTSWYLNAPETVVVLHLIKSQFGEDFEMYVGVSLKPESQVGDLYPKIYKCDWYGMLYLEETDGQRKKVLLDLARNPEFKVILPKMGGVAVHKIGSIQEFCAFVCTRGIALARHLRTRTGVLQMYTQGKLWPVPASLERALGLRV